MKTKITIGILLTLAATALAIEYETHEREVQSVPIEYKFTEQEVIDILWQAILRDTPSAGAGKEKMRLEWKGDHDGKPLNFVYRAGDQVHTNISLFVEVMPVEGATEANPDNDPELGKLIHQARIDEDAIIAYKLKIAGLPVLHGW